MYGVLAFAIGASVGSFLNVVADRLPVGRSLVRPSSYCESCDRPLGPVELVPIFSYLWLRGRCRHCGAAIPIRLAAVELVAGLLFTAAYFTSGLGLGFMITCLGLSLLLVVALVDLERGLILNRIIYPSVVVLLIASPFWSEIGIIRTFLGSQSMVASLLNSVLSGTGAFLFFLILFLAYPKGMGQGDIKLSAALGLLVGFPGIVLAIWLAAVLGGTVAIALVVLKKKSRKDTIPFGPFLALGGAISLLLANERVWRLFEELEDLMGLFA